MSVLTLDCKELRCPMPIVRISQMFRNMEPRDRLQIEACGPAFKADLEAWVRHLGHRLIDFQDGPQQRAIVEKQAGTDASL